MSDYNELGLAIAKLQEFQKQLKALSNNRTKEENFIYLKIASLESDFSILQLHHRHGWEIESILERLKHEMLAVLNSLPNKSVSIRNDSLEDVVYYAIQKVVELNPVNKETLYLLELSSIPLERKVVTMTGFIFDINELIDFHRTRSCRTNELAQGEKKLINPYTNEPLGRLDEIQARSTSERYVASRGQQQKPHEFVWFDDEDIPLPAVVSSETVIEPRNTALIHPGDRGGVFMGEATPVRLDEYTLAVRLKSQFSTVLSLVTELIKLPFRYMYTSYIDSDVVEANNQQTRTPLAVTLHASDIDSDVVEQNVQQTHIPSTRTFYSGTTRIMMGPSGDSYMTGYLRDREYPLNRLR